MKRLVLGPVEPDFDPACSFAVGPWCFAGAERRNPGWEDLPFPEPFPGSDDWSQAAVLTRQLADQLVPIWAERLNRRHGRTYSYRFWRLFLLNWLIMAIQPLWYRWRLLETVVAEATTPMEVEAWQSESDWHFPDLNALHDSFHRADFDFWFTSLVADAVIPAHWPRRARRLEPMAQRKPPAPPAGELTLLGRFKRRLFGRMPFDSIAGIRAAKVPLSLFIQLLPRRMPATDHFRCGGDSVAEHFPQAFLDRLDTFLSLVLPDSFTTGFTHLEAEAKGLRYSRNRLLVDTVASPDDRLRLVAAMALEHGEKLVTSQHGAAYGLSRAMSAAASTEYPYHGFVTWGWHGQENFSGRFVPLPAPALTRFIGRHRQSGDAIIHVGGTLAVRASRLGWLPRPVEFLQYRRDKLAFLGALPERLRQSLHYRPYLRNLQDLEDEDAVAAAYPEVTILRGDLHAALMSCRLLVLDHPGTTLAIAMAAGIPTVCFWRDAAWPSCRQAEPQMEALRRAGILFDDPAAAAAHVAAIADSPKDWWERADVRDARRQFCHHHARASRIWWLHWALALWRLARY